MAEIKAPLKVLYINHYGIFGGSQRSILELISGFPKDSVTPFFITPKGNGEKLFRRLNIPYTTLAWGGMSKFDHTRMGYYRGIRWVILVRELLYALPTVAVFWRFRKYGRQFDVVHINEITCLLPLILAKKWYKRPVVIHARAVFHNDPNSRITRIVKRIIDKYADKIIPIDETVATSLPMSNKLSIVHNSFSHKSELAVVKEGFAHKLASIRRRRLNLGFIGAIHVNKGIVELLEAIKLCKENQLDVLLVIAGNGNMERRTFFNRAGRLLGVNQDMNAMLHAFIAENHLQEMIYPIGFSTDTNDFFDFIDVICFPSYYNAPGRPVFEAAFFHKPSITAVRNPLPDTFIDGMTGLSVKEKDPLSIYNAIRKLYDATELRKQMGEDAYRLVEKSFDARTNSLKMLDIYYSLLA